MNDLEYCKEQNDTTVSRIYKAYEQKGKTEKPRGYLGASIIGDPCEFNLWLGFRWAYREEIEGRIYRLFQTGHREEDRMIDELKSLGIEITGQQFEISICGGHVKGHFDGVAQGFVEAPKAWHLAEFKTSNQKNFNQLLKKGCGNTASTVKHLAQLQIYMGEGKLKRAFYMVHCKNDDQIYVERIEYDPETHAQLVEKAKRIVFANEWAPSKDENYACKYCSCAGICKGNDFPAVNCRTCARSTPNKDGEWICDDSGEVLDYDAQAAGCERHLYHPELIGSLTVVESNVDWIKFETSSGVMFYNMTAQGFPHSDNYSYSSKELSKTKIDLIGQPAIESARRILGGEIASTQYIDEDDIPF